jgi:predicted ester cyclase
MSLEEKNIAIIRRYTEACNNKDLTTLEELVAPEYFHSNLQLRGWEELKQFETMIWNAFPDFHETNDEIIAGEDKVWYRLKVTGTHTGEFRGFPLPSGKTVTLAPTGKKLAFTGASIKRIVSGKIVESWAVYDDLDFFKELGVIEYKEFPDEGT